MAEPDELTFGQCASSQLLRAPFKQLMPPATASVLLLPWVCCCCCHQVSKRFPTMPFTLRGLSEGAEGDAKQELSQGQMRLGLVECLNHGLLHPYPVLHEKQGDLVAQVRTARQETHSRMGQSPVRVCGCIGGLQQALLMCPCWSGQHPSKHGAA